MSSALVKSMSNLQVRLDVLQGHWISAKDAVGAKELSQVPVKQNLIKFSGQKAVRDAAEGLQGQKLAKSNHKVVTFEDPWDQQPLSLQTCYGNLHQTKANVSMNSVAPCRVADATPFLKQCPAQEIMKMQAFPYTKSS